MKTYLKNKCAYARKQGYLRENTNQKQGRNDDAEEEEKDDDAEEKDEGEEEEEDAGHDDEEGQRQMQEQGEDGWDRGHGWGANSEDMNEDEDDDIQV